MKFKCKLSGCIVEFLYPVDIETTLANPAYEVVEDVVENETVVVEKKTSPLAKKLYTTKG
jgi:hypothetical protein